jgi:hypothetical protein
MCGGFQGNSTKPKHWFLLPLSSPNSTLAKNRQRAERDADRDTELS